MTTTYSDPNAATSSRVRGLYVGALLVFIAVNSLLLHGLFNERFAQMITVQENSIRIAKQSVESGFDQSATLIFQNIINQPKYRSLLYRANYADAQTQQKIRQEIYQSLLPVYESMDSFRLKQLHFHLHNNDSFLRFHRPLKFGDNLTAIRGTVAYVNRTGMQITGFEEGRIFNGYRFVFPMFWQGKPAGSVETSVAMSTLISEMEREISGKLGFMIRRDVVDAKVFDSEKSNYVQTEFSKAFLFERSLAEKSCCSQFNQIMLGWEQSASIEKWLNPDKIRTINLPYQDKYYLITFLPVKNPISQQTVGYILVRDENQAYQELKMEFLGIWLATTLTGVLIVVMLFNLKRKQDELVQSHLQIKKQNALFEKTQEMVQLGNWSADYNKQQIFWSDELYRILGYAPKATVASFERLLSSIHPQDRQRVDALYRDSIVSKKPYELECRIVNTQGEILYVSLEGEHEFDAQGNLVSSVGTLHDETSLRHNEQRLRSVKNRYKRLLNDLPVMVYRYHLSSRFEWQYINPVVAYFTGYSAEELLANDRLNLHAFIHAEDLQDVLNAVENRLSSGENIELEYRLVHRSGQIFHVKDTLRRMEDETGKTLVHGIISDQSEYFNSMSKLQKLIDQHPDILLITDGKQIQFGNQAFYEFVNITRPEDPTQTASYDCICSKFVKQEPYFYLGKEPAGMNWIDYLQGLATGDRKVVMANKIGINRVFQVGVSHFDIHSFVLSFHDVTHSEQERQHWQYKAAHDPLTGCYNRDFLEGNLGLFMRIAKRERNLVCLMMLDIDFFKAINDQYGHNEGDRVLVKLTNEIRGSIRESDLLVRWGGEEFLLLMSIDSEPSIEMVGRKLLQMIANKKIGPEGSLTVSMGATTIESPEGFNDALQRADAAMYFVKQHGRNNFLYLDKEGNHHADSLNNGLS